MCKSACPVTRLWLLDGNGHLSRPRLQLPGEEDGEVGAYQLLYLLAQQSCIRSKQGGASSFFFINKYRTKYVSVGFYPARDYVPLVVFGFVRRGCGPKNIILSDEQVDELAEVLPTLRDDMCSCETSVGVTGAKVVPSGWI
jgi:hypothetical protein